MSLLRKFSTIKIGGEAESLCWLSELSSRFEQLPRPFRVLGNGSNVLMGEKLSGTVILTRETVVPDPELQRETSDEAWIEAPSGIFLPRLAKWASERGFSGVEFMVGVPGTLGGAVVQNAGANQQETKDVLEAIEWFDFQKAGLKWRDAKDLDLQYRHSSLQSEEGVVTRVRLRLKKDDPEKIKARTQLNLDYRRQKTPFSKPSLGSMYTRLPRGDGPDSWYFPGQLIEEAGMKGERIGDIEVSRDHANYFINLGEAKFSDVLRLMSKVEEAVLKNSGIQLQPEIQIWKA